MAFAIYHTQVAEPNRIVLQLAAPLPMGGKSGLLAKTLPLMVAATEQWSLSADDLLRLSNVGDRESHRIFFDLTPKSADQLNLFELIGVSGRTASILTDALFHFKVAAAGLKKKDVVGPCEEITLSPWSGSPDRYESLRLQGGTRGGTWAWAEPPNSMSATIL